MSKCLGLLWAALAAFSLASGGLLEAQDDKGVLRGVSAPGRIEGSRAEQVRQAQAHAANPPLPAGGQPAVHAATAPATGSPPAVAPATQGAGVGRLAALGFLALAAAAGLGLLWHAKRKDAARRAAAAAARQAKAPKPAPLPTPEELYTERDFLAGAADEALRGEIAAYWQRVGKPRDFLSRNAKRGPEFCEAYSRAFLKLGAWEFALALAQARVPADPKDRALCEVLKLILAGRDPALFNAGEAYRERLSVAVELSERGYLDEAFSLLSDDLLLSAAKKPEESLQAAGVFQSAGKADDFVRRRATRRLPQFYKAYATAFHQLKNPEAALALLKKKAMEPEDYALFVACHKEVGRVAQLAFAEVPEADRVALAQALVDAGEEQSALKAVLEGRAAALGRADYALALRVCQKLGDFDAAARLLNDVQSSFPLKDAPELYYLYAQLCEQAGRVKEARVLYQKILNRVPDYKDVAERLEKLDSVAG